MVILTAINKRGARPPGLAPPFLFACVAREHTFSGEEGHLLARCSLVLLCYCSVEELVGFSCFVCND